LSQRPRFTDEVDGLAGGARLGDELLGLLRIIGIGLERLVEAERLRVDDLPARRQAIAAEQAVGERLAVDGDVHRLADLGVLGHLVVGGQHDERGFEALHRRRLRHALDELGQEVGDDVELAGDEARETGAGLADEAVGHLVDRRRAIPVVGVGDEDDVLPAVEGLELVGAGADRRLAELGVLRVFRRDHLHPVHARRQDRVRAGRGDLDGEVVDLLGAADAAEIGELLRLEVGVENALDARHHGVGVERLAVGKGDALAELELPGRVVDLGRRFGRQPRHQRAVGRAGHQGLVDVVVDGAFAAIVARLRIERRRLRSDGDRDLAGRKGSHRQCGAC
jgi:hypothetical protein